MTIFAELGLNPIIQANVKRLGYQTPTDIQQKSIGAVLSGTDTYAIAPTGTGKTAAYLLPLLQELSQSDHSADLIRPIRALVLVPTRDLAQQLEESIADYGKDLKLRTITLFGGIRIESQVKRFKRGADIIVSTPRRLIDLLKAKAFSLDQIQHFVMDEADRLVSMGIMPELSKILVAMPAKKQMILFSATDSKALIKFSQEHQTNKKLIKAANHQPALEMIFHTMYRCTRKDKTATLFKLLETFNGERVLLFTRTKNDVNLLTQRLNQQGFSSQGIHNEIPQKKRLERLSGFKNKEFNILVATDIASRGIDIDDLYYVINYDLPVNCNDYIHRVGRTARVSASKMAKPKQPKSKQLESKRTESKQTESKRPESNLSLGKKIKGSQVLGHAFSLVSPEQERLVEKIIKAVGKDIKLERNPFNTRKKK
jgi:ATP-dependent RNA helicase RhlE